MFTRIALFSIGLAGLLYVGASSTAAQTPETSREVVVVDADQDSAEQPQKKDGDKKKGFDKGSFKKGGPGGKGGKGGFPGGGKKGFKGPEGAKKGGFPGGKGGFKKGGPGGFPGKGFPGKGFPGKGFSKKEGVGQDSKAPAGDAKLEGDAADRVEARLDRLVKELEALRSELRGKKK